MNLAQIAKMQDGTWKVNDKYAVTVSGDSSMDGFFASLGGGAPAPAGEYILLAVSYTMSHAGFNHQFPGKGVVRWETLEFKHYHSQRGKWWTSEPGKTHLFVLRLEDIEFVLPPEDKGCWYSYPRVLIGGEEIPTSVSGGGPGDDHRWTDFFAASVHTACNLPLKKLKAIARVAVATSLSATSLKSRPGEAHREWAALRRATANKIGPASLTVGNVIVLAPGYSFANYAGGVRGAVTEVNTKRRYCRCGFTRVKFTQIDWVKTCEENHYAFPADFPAEPEPDEEKVPAMA